MIYRVHHTLSKGNKTILAGGLISSGELSAEAIEILKERGVISHIAAPPMVVLPKFSGLADCLLTHGIVDAEQFLETPDEKLSEILGAEPGQAAGLKQEVINWLVIPQPSC